MDIAVRDAVQAVGAKMLFLPPHSPDFSPIGNAFARFKPLLPRAATRAIDHLWRTRGHCVDVFAPAKCANYFAAAEYGVY